MTDCWRFVVPGVPVGQGRPRFVRVGNYVRTYTPKRSAEWQAEAATVFAAGWSRPPLDEPVRVVLVAVMPRPKRLLRKSDPVGRIICTTKPDVDNVAKAGLDALTKAGVIRDDAFVARLFVEKTYAAVEEGPRVEVTLSTLEDQ